MPKQITQKVKINLDEHVFIAGMTGTGKSVLAENYLAGYKYVIKLDTKDEVTEREQKGLPIWRGLEEGKHYTVVDNLADLENVTTDKAIYRPDFDEQNQEFYNAFFKYVYERKNTVVWIDELMSVADSPLKYPLYLKACYTRGRSRTVSLWALTQRPMDIPATSTANSTHFFSFNLMLPQDREKMSKVTGCREMLIKPEDYNFWYYRLGMQNCMKGVLKL